MFCDAAMLPYPIPGRKHMSIRPPGKRDLAISIATIDRALDLGLNLHDTA
jgi:aryl-alcohol dehydrogenase-like predicted oxidoreductase